MKTNSKTKLRLILPENHTLNLRKDAKMHFDVTVVSLTEAQNIIKDAGWMLEKVKF